MDVAALLGDPAAFQARYQPIVDVATHRVVAHEALLHCTAPGVTPGALFAAASANGQLARLDSLAREVAIRDAAGWLGDQLLFVKLAVHAGDLPADWLASTQDVAAVAGVPLRQVVLEVVQPPSSEPLERTARMVVRCRGAGFGVALVGATNPRVVRHLVAALLPDYLTLDRSVVSGLPGQDAVAAAQAILAEADPARVIAFGVENDTHAASVLRLGVPWAQGWWYGRPRTPTVDNG